MRHSKIQRSIQKKTQKLIIIVNNYAWLEKLKTFCQGCEK